MERVVSLLESCSSSVAVVDCNNVCYTRSDLITRILEIKATIEEKEKRLFFLQADQSFEFIAWYFAILEANHAVFLTSEDREKTARIETAFQPDYIVTRDDSGQWQVCYDPVDRCSAYPIDPDLSLLLSTSGSTGRPKLVRLSFDNVVANARQISSYLNLTPADRGMASLPFHYSYGHSVLTSHLFSGGSIVLSEDSVALDTFWQRFRDLSCSNFSGVPYSYELIQNSVFPEYDLPSLRFFTQAGGRLDQDRVRYFSHLAEQKQAGFFVMYGQTEATARIAYLPPEQLDRHSDCIGIPIPEGKITLRSLEDRSLITAPGMPGELIYSGPNVMMGYALEREDLASPAGIRELSTGDIAEYNEQGLFKIVGRLKSFVKIFGLRINLDDIEKKLLAEGIQCVVCGNDDQIVVSVRSEADRSAAAACLQQFVKLPERCFTVLEQDPPPLLPSGKVDKSRIMAQAQQQRQSAEEENSGSFNEQLIAAYRDVFNRPIKASDSYASLQGDSLSYVYVSTIVKNGLGYLPPDWESCSVGELCALAQTQPPVSGKRFLRPVETEVVFRALAILSVVISHASLSNAFHGGAAVLIMLAGFSFSRFSSDHFIDQHYRSYFIRLAKTIYAPYYLITILYFLATGQFSLSRLLLVSNLAGGEAVLKSSFLTPFWFLEVFFQITVLLALVQSLLFLSGRIRQYCHGHRFEYALLFYLASVLVYGLVSMFWDGASVLYRSPHIYAPLFILGWLVHQARTPWQKSLTCIAAMLIFLFNPHIPVQPSYAVMVTIMLAWCGSLWSPEFINRPVYQIANASFSIYLFHLIPLTLLIYHPLLGNLPGHLNNYLAIVLALMVGILHKRLQQNRMPGLRNISAQLSKHFIRRGEQK